MSNHLQWKWEFHFIHHSINIILPVLCFCRVLSCSFFLQAFAVSWKISDSSEFISRGVVRSAFGSLITREMSDFRGNLSFAVPTGTQTWPARSLCLVDYAHTHHPLILLVLNCYCEKSTDIQHRSSHHRILLLQVLSRKWVSKFKEKYTSWAGESFVLSCSHRPSVPWCSPWSPLWGQNPPVPGEGWCFLHGKAIYQSRRVRFSHSLPSFLCPHGQLECFSPVRADLGQFLMM